jgi:hypothetical protein
MSHVYIQNEGARGSTRLLKRGGNKTSVPVFTVSGILCQRWHEQDEVSKNQVIDLVG